MTIDDFILPFTGSLSADYRWVRLSKLIPWDSIEKEYAFLFPSDRGNVAKPVRMALGSLIIQARCGYTDRGLLEQITENPYLQYFIGLREYQLTRPFTPVALVKFRKRFNQKRLARINEILLTAEAADQEARKKEAADKSNDDGPDAASENQTKRPRTYRRKARWEYLSVPKQRNRRKEQIRRAIRKQLQ